MGEEEVIVSLDTWLAYWHLGYVVQHRELDYVGHNIPQLKNQILNTPILTYMASRMYERAICSLAHVSNKLFIRVTVPDLYASICIGP